MSRIGRDHRGRTSKGGSRGLGVGRARGEDHFAALPWHRAVENLQPEVADDSLIETAISLIARGTGRRHLTGWRCNLSSRKHSSPGEPRRDKLAEAVAQPLRRSVRSPKNETRRFEGLHPDARRRASPTRVKPLRSSMTTTTADPSSSYLAVTTHSPVGASLGSASAATADVAGPCIGSSD